MFIGYVCRIREQVFILLSYGFKEGSLLFSCITVLAAWFETPDGLAFSFSLGLLLIDQCVSPGIMSGTKPAAPRPFQLLQTHTMQRPHFRIQKTLLLRLSRWLLLLWWCSMRAETFSKVYGWLSNGTFRVCCKPWGRATWAIPVCVEKTAVQKTMQSPGVTKQRTAEYLYLKQEATCGTQWGPLGGGGGHMNQGGRSIMWMD